jgi:DNA-binding MarR family transcriptional regulator
MEPKEIRILKEMYTRTGGIFGSPFNSHLFQPGSEFTEEEFKNFLIRLEKNGYIRPYQGSDIIFTQNGLDWVAGEFNGENQRKKIRFLKALNDEAGGNEIKLDAYILQLGEYLGLKKSEIPSLLSSFQKEGYIRLTQTGGTSFISVSQIGKTRIEETTNTKQFNIFISHIHENETIANKLKDFLNSIFGDKIEVFISGDPQTIQAGQDFFTTIIDGIKKCDCMIILCSPQAITRYYIYFEAGGAALLDRIIIPICFDGQSPGTLPAPLDHIRAQAIDCADSSEKFEKHFQIFFQKIASQINVPIPTTSITSSEFYQMIAKPWTYESHKRYLFEIGLDQLEINTDEFSTDTYHEVCEAIGKLDPDFLRGMKQMGFLNKDNTVTDVGYIFIKNIVGEYVHSKI